MALVDNDQWKLLIYNTILSIVLMFPTIWLSGEFRELADNPLLYDLDNWISLTVTGVFGFLINIAVFLPIKTTSALTNNISGTLKACVQTVIAVLYYQNPILPMNAVGIFLVIAGSFLYSHVRYKEMQQNEANKTASYHK